MASIKTGLSPPRFEIALKERGGSILVLGFHGTVIVSRAGTIRHPTVQDTTAQGTIQKIFELSGVEGDFL